MSYCDGLITRGLNGGDCSSVPAKGFEREALLINRSDIDWSGVTFDDSKKNVLSALPLLKGKKAYLIAQQGAQPFAGSTSSGVVGTYGNSVTKNFVFAYLKQDQDLSENLADPILNGEFVAVLRPKDKGEDNNSAFVVLGLHNGLQMSALERDPYGDTFNGGLFTLTETEAPMLDVYLGATYQAGKSLWDSLQVAAQ